MLRTFLLLLSFSLPQLAWAQAAPSAPASEARPAQKEASPTWVQANLVIKVAQRDAAADALVAKTRELGGWFASLSSDAVSLRVPVGKVDELISTATGLGLVVERGYNATDLSEPIQDLRARLSAREQILTQYFAILPGAKKGAVLTVEREIVRVVREVESLRGQLRVLEHRATWATVDVAFEFRERNAPVNDGNSSFAWLNTLNVSDLVEDFRYGWYTPTGPKAGVALTPAGFSAYKGRRVHHAASPDEVLFRVRAERHKPQADVNFWKEAARERMEAAGYKVLREQDLAGGAGFIMELVAPFGAEDYAYAIAVVPKGRKLIIAEAAGEITRYEARHDAIIASFQELGQP